MIARHWRGWTRAGDADAYENFLKQRVLPGLAQLEGYRGGYILRAENTAAGETEFVVINLFESLQAVKRFAGDDYTVPVFEPEARALLSRIETVTHHYEVRAGSIAR
jgi:heme-degrading monooxygenase HmoA